MAREVKIKFGGAERLLWFDARDGIEIKKLLGKRPRQALDEDVLPIDPDGMVYSSAIDLQSLAVFLWRGISHIDNTTKHDPAITLDVVIDWLSEYAEAGPLLPLANSIHDALFLSGILGMPVDLKARVKEALEAAASEQAPQPEGDPTGKVEIPATESQTT